MTDVISVRDLSALTAAVNVWAVTSAFAAKSMPSDRKTTRPTFMIALGGILIALGWIFVILSGVLPTGRLFLFLLASLVVATAFFEMRLTGALLVALGISLLSLTYPGLVHAAIFAIFIGPLTLLTLQLARLQIPKIAQYLISHALMSLILFALIRLVGLDSFVTNRLNLDLWLLLLILFVAFQLLLIIYRQVLYYFEAFYDERIKPWIRRNS